MNTLYLVLLCALFSVGSAKSIASVADNKVPFTLEEAISGMYGSRPFSGKWISDNELEYFDWETQNIMVKNVETGVTNSFLEYAVISKYSGDGYEFSADRRFALISYDREPGFRHSSSARYVIYSIEDQTYADVGNKERLNIAQWGPQGNSFVYVFNNNLYYVSTAESQVEPSAITTFGQPGIIYCGIPDWVYEEEVLANAKAFWFSPEGDKILFAVFNDTNVPEITYMRYGTPGNILTQYPEPVKIRYPKAGATNPDYSMWYARLDTDKIEAKRVLEDVQNDIVYSVQWLSNEVVSIVFTNRVQNQSYVVYCTSEMTQCALSLSDKNPAGWANTNQPTFTSSLGKFLLIQATNESGNFDHLALYTRNGTRLLTQGNYVVTTVLGWDESNETIYYSATEDNEPSRKQVYAVKESDGKITCLTCELVSPEGNKCQSASASFSRNFSYAIISCTGPDPRQDFLYKTEIPLKEPLSVLEDNAALRGALTKKLLPQRMDLRVDVPGGFKAEVRLNIPPNADLSGKVKYPLLIYVYAGPDSKQISSNYGADWGTYLSTNLSIIYGLIDGRGSGLKGNDMLFAGYRALGTVEIEDQISVTKYLQDTLPFVDSNRSAIWGWSYGGFATGKTLEKDTGDVFKCGISVAPVTSWIYYDSIYTERYMGLPTESDNLNGYRNADLFNVTNLKRKQYYLIHGNADDNVHYQQSMLLSRALELNDVMFQQQSYPDENHGLGGVSLHLYHSMDRFWKKCFQLETNDS